MEVTFHPGTPAELRLTAAFMNDLADVQELQVQQWQEQCKGIVVQDEPAEVAPVKKTRSKKTEPATTAETPVESGSPETVEPADEEAGNDAGTAPAEAGGSTEATTADPASPAVTHNDLRKLFGELSQAGKGDAAIAALGKLGHKSIKSIPEEALAEALAAMEAV